jgi:hypothetical protein
MVADAEQRHPGSTTPGQEQARSTITRTTITPAPGSDAASGGAEPTKPSWRDRLGSSEHGELAAALEPYRGASILRFVMSTLLSVLCLLTVGGAILVLLLWQQERASGVLTSQVDRTWDLFDILREIERWVAFAVIPVAVAWVVLATINVRRATGQLRNPVIAGVSIVVGLAGVWLIGAEIVADSDDWLGQVSGLALQAVFLAVPLLAIERITDSADARHRPIRAAYVISIVFLAHLQFLGALSTIDQTSGPDRWGRLGAYLIIGALLQVLGSLSLNEAARTIEEGSDARYQIRQRFGESLLAQAAARTA